MASSGDGLLPSFLLCGRDCLLVSMHVFASSRLLRQHASLPAPVLHASISALTSLFPYPQPAPDIAPSAPLSMERRAHTPSLAATAT